MKVNTSALYLFIYLFSLSKWNLVESAETGEDQMGMIAAAAPEPMVADPNAELVAELNDLKAANDLMAQIADLKEQNAQLKAQLASGTRGAGAAGARGGIVAGRVGARGIAPRAPECGINNITSNGKVMATVAHNATAYVVDGTSHTLAFNQGTAQSNNNFNASSKKHPEVIMASPRTRVTIPAAEAAAAESLNAQTAEANAAGKKEAGAKAQPKARRSPEEVGIVNIDSDDKVMATVASDSSVYVVDGDKHTLAINQETSLSDNVFEKGTLAMGEAAHAAAAPKNLRQQPAAELEGEPLTVVDDGSDLSTVFTETPVFVP